MPETSPNLGLQAPLGTEPVSQGDDLMRANNTILDTAITDLSQPDGSVIRVAIISGTTNTDGFVTVTAAEMGLSTIVGGIANVLWQLGYNVPHWVDARESAGTLQVQAWSNNAAGSVARMNNTAVTLYVLAWGAP